MPENPIDNCDILRDRILLHRKDMARNVFTVKLRKTTNISYVPMREPNNKIAAKQYTIYVEPIIVKFGRRRHEEF